MLEDLCDFIEDEWFGLRCDELVDKWFKLNTEVKEGIESKMKEEGADLARVKIVETNLRTTQVEEIYSEA